jgi:hypothetical protein
MGGGTDGVSPAGASRRLTEGQVVFGLAVAAGVGAACGYLGLGTARATALGALGLVLFFGKNMVIVAWDPPMPVALGVAAVGGCVAGLCLGNMAAEPQSWVGAIVGLGFGVTEYLVKGLQRRGASVSGRVAGPRSQAEPFSWPPSQMKTTNEGVDS